MRISIRKQIKKAAILFSALLLTIAAVPLRGSDVVEVKATETGERYAATMEQVDRLRESQPEAAAALLSELLASPDGASRFDRFQIVFWELPALLSEKGKYQEAFEILRKGQQEGFYYPFILQENKFPPYIGNLEKLEGFQDFLEENKKLRSKDQEKAAFEYIVSLPEGYSPTRKYPLLIVFYGGFGSHLQQMRDWRSGKLEREYITAYFQGDQCMGSYLRAYQRDNPDQMVEAFRQIRSRYAVDESRVFIGAQSAGTHFAMTIMLRELFPVMGTVLAFPGTPQIDEDLLKKAAARNSRVVILAGERDPRFQKTKELEALLGKCGLKFRFKSFLDMGHEFPKDFPAELARALEFLEEQK
jgi:predicted esterase